MTTVSSKRKKYVREVTPNWWKKLDFYKLYIAREATAIPSLWFSLVLLYGVVCLSQGVEGLESNFVPFLQNPIVVLLNIIALAASLLNTVTYFFMTPKVLNIVVKNEKLNPNVITIAMWAVTAVVSILALVLIYL
ncbi:fumarate reductase subunit C [Bisgaardia hudsonensis]|uniref:Fumarate reductase subunit C n=1 Tax=Bisgaardia hudsonensis TaxID=109472 RepID=A0A4R2N325_9PAST|nr:fumarate reductase subunit FrdC [Bisgaardia hudsonensis]QLB12756.1 fumarate reductase subunit C [Bisgaardia hudsonensis]TCP14306.1 fumarate reductase subunit C [Bisgaardia hudsonensis]